MQSGALKQMTIKLRAKYESRPYGYMELFRQSSSRTTARREPGAVIVKADRSHIRDALEAFRPWASASENPSLDLRTSYRRKRCQASVVAFLVHRALQ